jgi:hypothetical protein
LLLVFVLSTKNKNKSVDTRFALGTGPVRIRPSRGHIGIWSRAKHRNEYRNQPGNPIMIPIIPQSARKSNNDSYSLPKTYNPTTHTRQLVGPEPMACRRRFHPCTVHRSPPPPLLQSPAKGPAPPPRAAAKMGESRPLKVSRRQLERAGRKSGGKGRGKGEETAGMSVTAAQAGERKRGRKGKKLSLMMMKMMET